MKQIFVFFRSSIPLLYIILSSLATSAQDLNGRLEQQYNKYKPGSIERLMLTGKYAQALFFNKQEDKAFIILNKNIADAKKLADGKYVAYLSIIEAMNYHIMNDVKAYENASRLAQIYTAKTKDLEIKGYVAYGLGWIQARNNEEAEAVRYFLQALSFYEKAKYSETLTNRKASVYQELSSIYANWNEHELHEKYSRLTLEVAIQQNNPINIFEAYMAMGYMYEQQYESAPNNKEALHQAESYYIKAIETYNTNKAHMPVPSNLSFVAINLAHLYLSYFPKSYENKVLHYANLAKKQGITTGDHTHTASANGILAEISLRHNNNEEAKKYLITALTELENEKISNPQVKLSIYESLSQLFQNENNFKEAINYQKAYIETFKQIYDQEKVALGKRLETQYEREKQKQELLTLQLASEKQEQQLKEITWQGLQQAQTLENLQLTKENQFRKLELTEIENSKRAQELRLSQLESFNRKQDIDLYKTQISYKERINNFYIGLTATISLLLILLLYAYIQRAKGMKQKEKLHLLEMEKIKQDSKISNLTVMLEGQEQERGRLARDLHDGLGGLLSGTKMHLSLLKNKSNDDIQPQVQKSISQIDLAVDELRRVAHNLMPDLLNRYGLREALKDYAVRMSNDQLEIDVQFLHDEGVLSKDKQLLVYRIIQELVNNAIKHASAKQILIQIVEEEDYYHITVEDDGQGFDIQHVKGNHSAGLHNIQSRIDFLKGTFHIHSEKNIGTSVEISFPKNKAI